MIVEVHITYQEKLNVNEKFKILYEILNFKKIYFM